MLAIMENPGVQAARLHHKKTARSIVVLLLCLGMASTAVAQYSVSNKKAVKEFEKGQQLLDSDAHKAFVHFRKALKEEPAFAEVRLTMAAWYMKHDSLSQAQTQLEAFLRYDHDRHERWAAAARQDLRCIAFRREAMAHPVPFTPMTMGGAVNSHDDEYMPSLSADGQTLLFSRYNRKAQAEDLYYSRLQDGQWTPAVRMPSPITTDQNEGSGCLSQDGRMLYFTACGRGDGAGRCDLYVSYRKGQGWSRPVNLGPAINTGSWESHPCLSIDGQTLYFVSNRKGGYGGFDIWKSTLEDGQWTTPVNLGPTINTSGDEKYPFLSFDNSKLYFSSNGHIGMGDMDLFVADRVDDSTWGEPVNLGYPINTSGDESSIIISPDGRTAIFSSDKYGDGSHLDLYYFALPEPVRPEPVEYKEEITEVAPTLEVGESITLKNVFFHTGKYDLLAISIVELDKVVEMMESHPNIHIELGGHTDNVGSNAMNQKLSEQRAKTVYEYLLNHGIEASRLSYKGYGASQPVADNSTAEGRRQNRRTVFTIVEK